jgi:hypothetical protein
MSDLFFTDGDNPGYSTSRMNLPSSPPSRRRSRTIRRLMNDEMTRNQTRHWPNVFFADDIALVEKKGTEIEKAHNQTAFEPKSRRRLASRCVKSSVALRDTVRNCDSNVQKKPCRIDICKKRITTSRSVRRILDQGMRNVSRSINQGIDLSNKRFYINCRVRQSRCIFDGEGLSRMFSGTNTTVTFQVHCQST